MPVLTRNICYNPGHVLNKSAKVDKTKNFICFRVIFECYYQSLISQKDSENDVHVKFWYFSKIS